jgi:SAM-dependent methyltransferase
LSGRAGFLGARAASGAALPVEDATADLVVLVEAIEHLDDAGVDGVLGEARRITRPGGHLLITTPFEEDLAQAEVMCPDCGCVFHSVQHQRSVSPSWLRGRTAAAGFDEVVCRPTLFSHHPRWIRPLQSLKRALARDRPPHLLYVGRAR